MRCRSELEQVCIIQVNQNLILWKLNTNTSVDDDLRHLLLRYFNCLVGVKQQVNKDLLIWNQLQEGINSINNSVQDEHERMEHMSHKNTHYHTIFCRNKWPCNNRKKRVS